MCANRPGSGRAASPAPETGVQGRGLPQERGGCPPCSARGGSDSPGSRARRHRRPERGIVPSGGRRPHSPAPRRAAPTGGPAAPAPAPPVEPGSTAPTPARPRQPGAWQPFRALGCTSCGGEQAERQRRKTPKTGSHSQTRHTSFLPVCCCSAQVSYQGTARVLSASPGVL